MKRFTTCLCPLIVTAVFACTGAAVAQTLTLQQAQALARANNPDLRLAKLQADAASAALTAAGAAPNPVLTLQSANINPHAGISSGPLRDKTVDSTVRIDQLIERGGKRMLRIASASKAADASVNDEQDARRQLALLVEDAYFDLLASAERLAITRESAELFDGTVAAARTRQQAGDLAGADVARARVDALRAHNDVLQAESDQFAARQTLGLLIGLPGATLEAGDGWPPIPAGDGAAPMQDAEAALARRPDLLAAQARIAAAEAGYQLALAARHADITVGVQAEHYPASPANGQGSGNSFGIALQVPLQLRYHYDGEIRAAGVAVEIARNELQRLHDAAFSEWQRGQQQVASAAARLQRYDGELLAAAKKSADAAEFAFQRGAIGIMDLLDARRSYRSTQLDAVAARADYAKSLAARRAAIAEGT